MIISASLSVTGVIESRFPFESILIVSSHGVDRISAIVITFGNFSLYSTSTQIHIGFSRVDFAS